MTPEELTRLSQIEREKQENYQHCIGVCVGSECAASRSDLVLKRLQEKVQQQGLRNKCLVRGTGCRGLCSSGPMVSVDPEGTLYQGVKVEHTDKIMASLGKEPVQELLSDQDSPFYTRQHRINLENAGKIDPDKIEDYIAVGGYSALTKCLMEMTPVDVVDEISRSGLRGRGGAGYPTGLKWSTVAKAQHHLKYVVCNGDEGDPGAFMDRGIMEDDPHRIIEGMAIAGYAIGASGGYIYVRAEYPLAFKRLQKAITQAKQDGFLGNSICGTSFDFVLELRLGAGAFVCGEETALIASIEGGRGTPKPRPPYPAVDGLWGCPTLINNVETFGNVPAIIRKGVDWFSSVGTEKSKGTKVFALSGCVTNSGLIEVPMGITLREIVYDIGGGIPEGKKFKAVQSGGPCGGCIPEKHLDSKVDYESLTALGSIMGSGGLIVMDETSCMVDVAKYFMEFCMAESCGKCIPCRTGTAQMHDLLTKICTGEGEMSDIDMLEELCDLVKSTSLCGLGQSAPNPVYSTLRYFRHEYEAHILEKRCPAGVCAINQPVEV